MDLKNTQLKDTYGNLLTIGTTAGSPTTGTLENGDGEDITALDVAGTITSNGLTVEGIVEIDGSAFGNISKQAFTRTDASWSINNETALRIYGNTGDTTSPSTKRMELNTGGDISFYDSTGTNPDFYWDASAGSLGIGTDAPNSKLNVISNGVGTGIWVGPTNSNFGLEQWYDSATGTVYFDQKYNNNGGSIFFRTKTLGTPVNALTILGSGNVGIGTNDPSTKLEVLGSSNSNYLRLSGDDAAGARGLDFTSFTVNANAGAGHQINAKSIYGTLTFATSNTERMRIDASGNVGINCTPVKKLQVTNGVSGDAGNLLLVNTNDTNGDTASLQFSMTDSDSFNKAGIFFERTTTQGRGSLHLANNIENNSNNVTKNDARLTIDSSGNVGIGCSPSAKLDVDSGSTQTVSVFKASSTSTVTNNGGALIGIRNTNDTDGNMEGLFFQNSNGNSTSGIIGYNVNHSTNEGLMTFGVRNSSGTFGEKMRIDSSGKVGIGVSPTAPFQLAKTGTAPSGTGNGYGLYITPATSGEIFIDSITGSSGNTSASLRTYNNGTYTKVISNASGNTTTFETAGSERMRIDSSGNVILQTVGAQLRFQNSLGPAPYIENSGEDASTAPYGQDLLFATGGTERMRIDSNGQVGIGTDDPSTELEVGGSSNTQVLISSTTNTGNSQLYFGDSDSDTAGVILYRHNGDSMAFEVNDTERMRIDSSGNLLVGTNTTTAGNEGMVYFNGSSLRVTRDSDEPLNLDRLTTDGSLINFKKDGSTVGSIGVTSGSFAIGQTDTGIGFFNGDRIAFPATSAGAVQDNAIDLGYSGGRFKDLYLSGSVYLGGTTSSNALDDYEEGTWTPALVLGSGSVTNTTQAGNYTKIGRQVTVKMKITINTVSTPSGTLEISGMPYTATTTGGTMGSISIWGEGFEAGATQWVGTVTSNSATMRIYNYASGSVTNPADKLQNSCILNVTATYFV